MTIPLIISISILLLLAYIFDISSSRTKIPAFFLLLVLGFVVRQITHYIHLPIPDLNKILPILGTVGLVLIVLEGSLELELNKSKIRMIKKSFFMGVIPVFLIGFVLALFFYYYDFNATYKMALSNAIPFAIISSAIAIPSVQNLFYRNREFVTYESCWSDIIGVIFFNFVTKNATITIFSFGNFFLQLCAILVVTFVSTIGLAYLLSQIKHHVKFVPIMITVVLIYTFTEIYHLPGLVMILMFGLFLGNLDEMQGNKFIQRLHPEILEKEVHKFKELISEIAFLVRSLFFLLFGYLMETRQILNPKTIIWASGITLLIFISRYVLLRYLRVSTQPIMYIAPRGLITILLFLSIPVSQKSTLVNESLIIQVIILTALIMMGGMMLYKKKEESQS
jgi:potassium/hydrogen antiporter